MFFSALVLSQLIATSGACEFESQIQHVFPASGSFGVAQNVVLRVTMDGGILEEIPEFKLTSGEKEIEIEVVAASRDSSADSQYTDIEIIPLEHLPADQAFVLSVVDEEERQSLSLFETSDQLAELPEEIPSLMSLYQYDAYAWELPDECILMSDEIDFYFSGHLRDQFNIQVYAVDQSIREQGLMVEASDLTVPFHTLFKDSEYSDSLALIPPQPENTDMCFVYAFSNDAGELGPISDVVCLSDEFYTEFRCGTGAFWGCSSTAPSTFGWMGMVLALLGLQRRRQA